VYQGGTLRVQFKKTFYSALRTRKWKWWKEGEVGPGKNGQTGFWKCQSRRVRNIRTEKRKGAKKRDNKTIPNTKVVPRQKRLALTLVHIGTTFQRVRRGGGRKKGEGGIKSRRSVRNRRNLTWVLGLWQKLRSAKKAQTVPWGEEEGGRKGKRAPAKQRAGTRSAGLGKRM